MSNTVIVDNEDPGVLYAGEWTQPDSNTEYLSTISASTVAGSSWTFKFSGTQITSFGTVGPANLTTSSTYAVDGADPDTFVAPVTVIALYHTPLWASGILADGEHTLAVTYDTNISTPGLFFDYVMYTPSLHTLTNQTVFSIDDRDPRISYSGVWSDVTARESFRHTIRGAQNGSSFTFDFHGIGISVSGALNNTILDCKASFLLDNGSESIYETPNDTRSMRYSNQFFSANNLAQADHKLQFTSLSDGPLWIDYILVKPGSTLANSSRRTPVGAIVGGVVGGVLFFAALGLVVFFYHRRKTRVQKHNIAPQAFTEVLQAFTETRRGTRNDFSGKRHPHAGALLSNEHPSTQPALRTSAEMRSPTTPNAIPEQPPVYST